MLTPNARSRIQIILKAGRYDLLVRGLKEGYRNTINYLDQEMHREIFNLKKYRLQDNKIMRK